MKQLLAVTVCVLFVFSCQKDRGGFDDPNRRPEAHSLLGQPLYSLDFPEERLKKLNSNLAQAKADYDSAPKDPEKIIWFGRRTAYLARYREAIAIYSKGIEQYPDNPKLYRHRGHRYISVRDFDNAIADLEKAAELTQQIEDEIEPDGQPNEFNKPRSTLKSNIWYQLGLAHYLKGHFEKALAAYLECMKYSTWNHDMLCATSDWLYMTYRRLGKDEEAKTVLEPIQGKMDILENHSYHKRLLMYKGLLSPEDLLSVESGEELDIATQGYGVGNWHFYNGNIDKAKEIFQKVVAGTYWPAFGYIAAEADLARLRTSQK
ncbi:tetratricopeptide repeat protein [bacterium]|nr:tetratricopeptide repeat protein [bacterium]